MAHEGKKASQIDYPPSSLSFFKLVALNDAVANTKGRQKRRTNATYLCPDCGYYIVLGRCRCR